jgi:hypothetical protein
MSDTVTKWAEVKTLVDMTEKDMLKNSHGNVAAGIRLRKTLRLLKKAVQDVVRATVEADKAKTEARKAKRAAVVVAAEAEVK